MITSISSFNINNVPVPKPITFLLITVSTNDSDAASCNGMSKLLASKIITLFIDGDPIFINDPRSLPRKPYDCIIFKICAANSFILAVAGIKRIAELFTKVIQRFETYLSVNNNL